MSRTKKPCPGCGEVNRYRPAAEVCHTCQEHIKLGKQAIAEAKKTGPGNVWVRGYHGTPYVHRGSIGWRGDPDCRDIGKALGKVFKSIAVPSQGRDTAVDEDVFTLDVKIAARMRIDQGNNWHQPDFQVPAEFLDAIRELYVDLCHVTAHAYEEGKQDGRNILDGLASGEISVRELNEETARSAGLTYKPFRGTAAKKLRKKKAKKKTKKKKAKEKRKT